MDTRTVYIKKLIEKNERQASTAMINYQDSGSSGYYRAYEKYTRMAEIFRIALNSDIAASTGYQKRCRNIEAYKEKLEKRDYSFEEIENIFSDIMKMLG